MGAETSPQSLSRLLKVRKAEKHYLPESANTTALDVTTTKNSIVTLANSFSTIKTPSQKTTWQSQNQQRKSQQQRNQQRSITMRLAFSQDDFLKLGLTHLGFSERTINNTCNMTNVDRFRDGFYADPTTCQAIFYDIQESGARANPKHLLLALYYLKRYPSKHGLAAFLDETEKTGLKWVHAYVAKIQALKERKVRVVCKSIQSSFSSFRRLTNR